MEQPAPPGPQQSLQDKYAKHGVRAQTLQQLLLHMQLSNGLTPAGPSAAAKQVPGGGQSSAIRRSYAQASELLSALLKYDSMAGRLAPHEGAAEGGSAAADANGTICSACPASASPAPLPGSSPFSAAFEQELHRSKRFIAQAYEGLWHQVDWLCEACSGTAGSDSGSISRANSSAADEALGLLGPEEGQGAGAGAAVAPGEASSRCAQLGSELVLLERYISDATAQLAALGYEYDSVVGSGSGGSSTACDSALETCSEGAGSHDSDGQQGATSDSASSGGGHRRLCSETAGVLGFLTSSLSMQPSGRLNTVSSQQDLLLGHTLSSAPEAGPPPPEAAAPLPAAASAKSPFASHAAAAQAAAECGLGNGSARRSSSSGGANVLGLASGLLHSVTSEDFRAFRRLAGGSTAGSDTAAPDARNPHLVPAAARPEAIYHYCVHAFIAGSIRLEPIYWALSELTARAARMEDTAAAAAAAGEEGTQWRAPTVFQRSTTKYWVAPHCLPAVKARLAAQLPLLVYGRPRPPPDQLRSCALRPSPPDVSSAITSVYYDSQDLQVYHTRIRRDDGASLVRVRWYGARDAGSGRQQLFVERKTHREPWSGERSVKERAAVKQAHISSFLEGGTSAEEVAGAAGTPQEVQLLQEVQQFLLSGPQAPAMRTSYRRMAFQQHDSNAVRVSLDTEVVMVRERDGPVAPGDWCRDLSPGCCSPPGPSDVVQFPYAILEVKLQVEAPGWVKDLEASGLLVRVPKFSKFLHGMALLFPGSLQVTPHWFMPVPDQPGCWSPASIEELADEEGTQVAGQGAGQGQGGLDTSQWPATATGGGAEVEQQGGAPAGSASGLAGLLQRSRAAATRLLGHQAPTSLPATSSAHVSLDMATLGKQAAAAHWHSTQQAAKGSLVDAASGRVAPHGGSSKQWQEGAAERSAPSSSSSGQMPANCCCPATSSAAAGAAAMAAVTKDAVAPLPSRWSLLSRVRSRGLRVFVPRKLSRHGPDGAQGVLQLVQQQQEQQASSLPRAPAALRQRIEPKTFFANERTFLQWLNIAMLILLTAMSLLGSASLGTVTGGAGGGTSGACAPGDASCHASKLAGAAIAPVGVVFMVYALYMYRKRSGQIMARAQVRYDDQRGPVLLTLILIVVACVAYGLTVKMVGGT